MDKVKYITLMKNTRGKLLVEGDKCYRGQFKYKNTKYYCGTYATIREAQIAVDRKRLELGLDTIVLKKIKN